MKHRCGTNHCGRPRYLVLEAASFAHSLELELHRKKVITVMWVEAQIEVRDHHRHTRGRTSTNSEIICTKWPKGPGVLTTWQVSSGQSHPRAFGWEAWHHRTNRSSLNCTSRIVLATLATDASLWVVVSSGFRGMSFKPYYSKTEYLQIRWSGVHEEITESKVGGEEHQASVLTFTSAMRIWLSEETRVGDCSCDRNQRRAM